MGQIYPIDASKLEQMKECSETFCMQKKDFPLEFQMTHIILKTNKFLKDSLDYLESILKTYNNYFTMKDLNNLNSLRKLASNVSLNHDRPQLQIPSRAGDRFSTQEW